MPSNPPRSQVRQYRDDEVDLAVLSEKAFQAFGYHPFAWQLDSAKSILCGKDVILDVGTGCGKTLCFLLPLLMNETDVALIISPLSALMLEQADRCPIPTVAVCQETIEIAGKEQLYKDIVARRFRQVIVSPEIVVSPEFHRAVFRQQSLTDYLRVVCIDEAHCINIWGGTFCPDYAALGIIRGKLPKHVAFMAASATFPDHILDAVRSTLHLSVDAHMIRVTNERPNIALSVRGMKHIDESKADLRFLIPASANTAEDIPVTLVYCNQRGLAEECTDRARGWACDEGISPDCIQYYHALVGSDKKQKMQMDLARGTIRILFCTTALGMGCDLRNVARVVMWGLPTSFCSLVQEAGRAGRDLDSESEAILIVPKALLKGIQPTAVSNAVSELAMEGEALGRLPTDAELEVTEDLLDNEGVRRTTNNNFEDDVSHALSEPAAKRYKRFTKETNIYEARGLTDYIQTTLCRWSVWNTFFKNSEKFGLEYGVTSMYQQKPGRRCCDNCQPDLFRAEVITVQKVQKGIKLGKKNGTVSEEIGYISKKLHTWRDSELMDICYPDITGFSGALLISDAIIQKIAACGERVRSYEELRWLVHWNIGHDKQTGGPNKLGILLLEQLGDIYEILDANDREDARVQEVTWVHSTAESYRKDENDEEGGYIDHCEIAGNLTWLANATTDDYEELA